MKKKIIAVVSIAVLTLGILTACTQEKTVKKDEETASVSVSETQESQSSSKDGDKTEESQTSSTASSVKEESTDSAQKSSSAKEKTTAKKSTTTKKKATTTKKQTTTKKATTTKPKSFAMSASEIRSYALNEIAKIDGTIYVSEFTKYNSGWNTPLVVYPGDSATKIKEGIKGKIWWYNGTTKNGYNVYVENTTDYDGDKCMKVYFLYGQAWDPDTEL